MRGLTWLVLLCGTICLSGQDTESEPEEKIPDFPQWKAEDWESVQNGEIIPGSTIFGDIALERLLSGKMDPIVVDPKVREIPEEEVQPEEHTTTIEDQFLSTYFHNAPETYLVDPQDLLSNYEKQEREKFLNFHADNYGLDLYLYLFDTNQEVPVGESSLGIILDHFEQKGPAAVVFYYLGDPARAELRFTEDLAGIVSLGDKRDLRKLSIEEAMENEEPLAQLEAFSKHLSQRLYWLERDLAEQGVLEEQKNANSQAGNGDDEASVVMLLWGDFKSDTRSYYAVMGSLGFAGGLGLFILMRYLIDRKRVFVFPDAQGNPLLGAPHAPGVGSVLSYANRAEPPSLQRNNFPDYLRRL